MANNLSLLRGNTLIINYTNQDNTPASQGGPLPISLDGATIYFTVKATQYDTVANDSSATWQLTSTGNLGNTCMFTSTAAETWVTPANYYYDITIKYSNGDVITPVTGRLLITGTPTNIAS